MAQSTRPSKEKVLTSEQTAAQSLLNKFLPKSDMTSSTINTLDDLDLGSYTPSTPSVKPKPGKTKRVAQSTPLNPDNIELSDTNKFKPKSAAKGTTEIADTKSTPAANVNATHAPNVTTTPAASKTPVKSATPAKPPIISALIPITLGKSPGKTPIKTVSSASSTPKHTVFSTGEMNTGISSLLAHNNLNEFEFKSLDSGDSSKVKSKSSSAVSLKPAAKKSSGFSCCGGILNLFGSSSKKPATAQQNNQGSYVPPSFKKQTTL